VFCFFHGVCGHIDHGQELLVLQSDLLAQLEAHLSALPLSF
jgi:hypothetical protein